MIGKTDNAVLLGADKQFLAGVPKAMRRAVQNVVLGGYETMQSPQMQEQMKAEINGPGTPAENAGEGVAKLIGVLYAKAKPVPMPMEAAIIGGNLLLLEALCFMEEAGLIKVDNAVLGEALLEYGSSVMQVFGLTPEKVAAAKEEMARGKTDPAKPAIPVSAPASPPPGILAMAKGAA